MIELVPHQDVFMENGRTSAASTEPWLRFRDASAFAATGFVEVTYRCGLYDDPVRPVLRFVTKTGEIDRILPGPVAGAGIWRGATPKNLDAVLISPCARAGRFDFIVKSVKPLHFFDMLALVWKRRRGKLWSVLLPTVFGYKAEAQNAIDWAISAQPLNDFESWRALRERPTDTAGIDSPRSDWSTGPLFLIVIDSAGSSAGALARTQVALAAQTYRKFSAEVPVADADYVAHIRAGDAFAPQALAVFAEEIARSPHAKLLYADELIDSNGVLAPEFKPNWSPLFESQRSYLGRCVFVRADMRETGRQGLSSEEVVHLRRWLMTRADTRPPAASPPPRAARAPSVSIVLLTKDRADLLGPCLDSVLRLSTHPDFDVLIVDNGTKQAAALKILDNAALDPRVRLLRRPGPFNFARLNNEAARATKGAVLVFLNNDTEIQTADWLERLAERAIDPAAGAVGALLLFPDGRIQHAGVTVGIGQDAGHFGALEDPLAPSWLDKTRHLHETSAVTAACMGLERRKFDAIGGFDEVNLPIEFNDVDLCLRLAEKGWRNVYTPEVRVTHKESASRGNAMLRPLSLYAKEREYFRRRWRSVIRDDPYFHPALSLYARCPALS